MAIPHLPKPFPALITNGFKYVEIGNMFIDDLAVAIFAIGIVVWIAS